MVIKFGVKYKNCHKGAIILTGDIYTGMVRLGLQDNPNANKSNSIIILGNNSKLYLGSNLSIASGIKILTGENTEIHFGNDAFIGWDVSIRDTVGHPIFENGIQKPLNKPITLDDKVWIAANATILKGTLISTGSVVACNSLVSGLQLNEPNCLVAGLPGKVIKHNISWKK